MNSHTNLEQLDLNMGKRAYQLHLSKMKFPRICPHYDNAAKLILWKEPGIPMPIPFPKEDVSLLSSLRPLWYYITFSLEIYGYPINFPIAQERLAEPILKEQSG